jgi:hypothetical protein
MEVFFLTTMLISPLSIFIPKFKGTTSRRKKFSIKLSVFLVKIAAWIAAPAHTAISGVT